MNQLLPEVLAAKRLPPPKLARAIREAAGVSQARLATELGVERITVSRWEGAKRRPRGDLLVRYAALLDEIQRAE